MAPKKPGLFDKIGTIFSQALEASSATDAPKPLGVPKNYVAPGGTLGGAVIGGRGTAVDLPTPPRYFDGDQYLLGGQSPAQIIEVQQMLKAGGWYTSEANIVWGRFGPETAKAYEEALKAANRSGKPIDVVLKEAAELASRQPQEGSGGYKLPVIQVDSKEDLRQVFDAASTELIGHAVSDEDLDSMVLSYQGMQIARQQRLIDIQKQEYGAAQGGATGFGDTQVVEGEMSPQAYAEKRLKEIAPWNYAATKGKEVGKVLDQALNQYSFNIGGG